MPNRARHWASAKRYARQAWRVLLHGGIEPAWFLVLGWLRGNGHDLRSADLRAYFTQWKRAQEHDGFLLDAAGRWKYFTHLLSYPWMYGEIMTQRHRVYSYMGACSALVLGYHHLHLFDDARRKRKEWMASSSEKTLVALPAKAKAAVATKS